VSNIIHLIDRSRVEAREDCPMLRFLNYDFEETGIEAESQSLPLLSGIAIHAAHARLLAGGDLDTVVSEVIRDYIDEIKLRGLYGLDVTNDIIREQSSLLEGMLRVWAVERMPRILEEYEVVSIEQTFDWALAPGLVQRLRMDAILRRRDDGLLHILDYKTMKYPSEMFFEQKEHDLQTCLYLQALKERSGEFVGGMLYEGLIKGRFAKDSAKASPFYGQKIQQSPYTIAYKLNGVTPSESVYQTNYTPKKGYHKVRTFDEMPMKRWVEEHMLHPGMDDVQPNELFVSIPAIAPPPSELEEVKAQVIFEETKYHDDLSLYRSLKKDADAGDIIAAGMAAQVLRRMAPKRRGRCFKYGQDNKCVFTDVCFNQGAMPLEEGGFRRRRPHHDTDLEMVA
jgi:hypothetical protein